MHCLFILLSNAVRWATFRLSIIISPPRLPSARAATAAAAAAAVGASWVCDCVSRQGKGIVFPVNKTKLHTIWHALNETAHLKYQNV